MKITAKSAKILRERKKEVPRQQAKTLSSFK